jgi:glycosyltransferase involved in cell wall biosynthesis
LISIITPTHETKYLLDAYQSLLAQTDKDWEWILLYNGDLQEVDIINTLPAIDFTRVHLHRGVSTGLVGDLKWQACQFVNSDITVELDQDDTLLPSALAKVRQAFDDPEVVFVYSNAAHYNNYDKSPRTFNSGFGWTYRDVMIDDTLYKEILQPTLTPQHLSYIWYAPDHVRAWRTSTYKKVGGHNRSMKILDDQDLMIRLYYAGKFHHINELLYLYRVHETNTYLRYNDDIQNLTHDIHDQQMQGLMMRWCDENNLRKIDLCTGTSNPVGLEPFDKLTGTDLNENWTFAADNSVGFIRAVDAIEHLKSPIHLMNEAYRVLCHGGMFMIEVPSTDGRGAFQDPTHVSFWNTNSFWYYTDSYYNKYFGNECKVRFQMSRVANYFPNDFCKTHNIVYSRVHLTAIKQDIPRYLGSINI